MAIFVDPAGQREFAANGLVVVPLLDTQDVAELTAWYLAHPSDGDQGMAIDFLRDDRSRMAEVAERTAEMWGRCLPRVLIDHRIVVTTFIAKHPGEDSAMPIHDDTSFTDVRLHRGLSVWVPLVDVGPELDNGHLEVIPRSHKLTEMMSGHRTPDLFRPYLPQLLEHIEPLTLRAGDAAIYDNRLLHRSPPNRSDRMRLVLGAMALPEGAECTHVVATSRRHRRLYRVDPEFHIRTHPLAESAANPEHYVMIDEFDDECRLRPDHVAAVFGGPPRLPGGPVGGGPDAPEILGRAPRRLPLIMSDPPVTGEAPMSVDAGPGLGSDGDGFLHTAAVHGASQATWHRFAGQDRSPAPRWATGVAAIVEQARHAATLVVHDRGGVEIDLGGDAPWHLDVVEATPGAASLHLGAAVEMLDELVRLELAPGTRARAFNDGPGPLVLLLSVPEPADRTAPTVGALRKVLDRVRTRRDGRTTGPR